MSVLSVLYVAPSIPVPGFHGGSTHILELSKNLVKLGCNFVVLARRLPGQPQFEVVDGVKVFRVWRGLFKSVFTDFPSVAVDSRGGLRLLKKVYFNTIYLAYTSSVALYLANKYKAHVILERGDSYGAGAFVSLATGIPLITEIRDLYQPKISLLVARRLLAYDGSVLKDKRFLSKVTTMRGGVDTEKFKPITNKQDAKAVLKLLNKFVIGYSGSFAKSHRTDILVILARRLIKMYDNKVHFLVIGPSNPQFFRIISSSKLRHYFSFVGPINHDELPKYLNAIDVGLALYDPKMVAGPPYKVYEYMACGIPAITTETIYSRKIIKDGLNGFLVKMNDFEEVLHKISLLIENSNLLHQISVKARETALRFSWREEAERILKLFKAICT